MKIRENIARQLNEETIEVKCSKLIKQQLSHIMRKYGWKFNDFEKLFKSYVGFSVNLEKELAMDEENWLPIFPKPTANNWIFSNNDESIKVLFLEFDFLEIIISKDNQTFTYDIEKNDGKKEIGTKLRKKIRKVINGKVTTFEVEENKIEMVVYLPLNQKYIISVFDDNSYPSKIIKLLNKKREDLEEILAYTDEENLGNEIFEGIQQILNNSNISESEERLFAVVIEKIQHKENAEITFRSIRRPHLQENTIAIKEENEAILYYLEEEPYWSYTDGCVIIKGHNNSKVYDITVVEKSDYDLNRAFKRAKDLAEVIANW